ncbi:MAG: hypothetical protein ABL997_00650 [Planctomycetota bacterium]
MTNLDASDWDPLPEAETGMHPGEVKAMQQTSQSVPPAAPAELERAVATVVAAARKKPVDEPNAAAEPNLLDAMQRPDARPGLAAVMGPPMPKPKPRPVPPAAIAARNHGKAAGSGPNATPLELPAAGPIPGRDPREQAAWFLAMPVVEQVRLQRLWHQDRTSQLPGLDALGATAAHKQSQQSLERFWVAYVVFFVAGLPLMLSEGLSSFVRMALAGCITGMLWQVVPHTRKWCAGSAVMVYIGVAMLPRTTHLLTSPFDSAVALGGAVLVGYIAGAGVTHEQRLHQRDEAA